MEFRVLGLLEVWAQGKPVSLGGPRAKRVLATLLIRANRVVSIDHLVEAAWGREAPATAEHQVRKMVAELRRRIPGGANVLLTHDPGYRAVLQDDQLDLVRFERLLARARDRGMAGDLPGEVAHLRAALDLWRGPVLEGLDIPLLDTTIGALEERRLSAQERLLELRLELGEAREVVEELTALVAAHPLRERLRVLLMVALYRSGRRAEALDVYHDTRRLLSEQLGIDPSPEVSRCYQQILESAPALDRCPSRRVIAADTSPCSLPYDLPDFTGREEEISRLLAAVPARPETALAIITIDGMGGSGKSTLAVHAAHRLAKRYPDGQLFIDLCGFTPGRSPLTPAAALDTLLRAIGVPGEQIPDDLNSRAMLWRVKSAGRRLLLLLDNAANTAQIRPLIPGTPGCLVMVTSRVRLTGLDGAVRLSLGLPTVAEGIRMISAILGADRVTAELEWAADLVRACGRLPLALRIAAARLQNRPHWPIEYLVRRLRQEKYSLDELIVDDRSVRAALEISIDSMSPEHRRLFRLLGLHPGTDFDAYAAAAMADLPLQKAEALLEDLLDASLLVQRVAGRYTFHDLLRNLAQKGAWATMPQDEREQAQRLLLDYYLQAADLAARQVQPGRQPLDADLIDRSAALPPMDCMNTALAWFDTERVNLLASISLAERAGLDSHIVHLPRMMAYYLRIRAHLQDELTVLRKAVDAARRLGRREWVGISLTNLAVPYWHLGRARDGLRCVHEALMIARETGDRVGEGLCLGRIGMFYNSLGRYREAIDCLDQALAIYEETGTRREVSTALASLYVAQAALGRYNDARRTSSMMLAASRELGDRYGEIVGLVSEAECHAESDELDLALKRLDEAMAVAHQIETPYGEVNVLARYADVYRRLGCHDEAHQYGYRALRLLQTVRWPAMTVVVYNVLGLVYQESGDHERALECHRQARDLAERIELRIELTRAFEGMARALCSLGRSGEAREYWEQAVEHHQEMGTPVGMNPLLTTEPDRPTPST